MVDTAFLGAVILVVIAIAGLLVHFFGSNNGDEFEKVFSQDALKLLNDQAKKDKKQKVKAEKKKNKKDAPDNGNEKQEVENNANAAEKVRNAENVVEREVKAVVRNVDQLQQPKDTEVQNGQNVQNAPKVEKKKGKGSIKELDTKRVLAKLSNVEQIEPEYVQFLTNFFRDTDVQKNNLTSEVKALQKRYNESQTKYEKVVKDKSSLENKQRDEHAKVAGLNVRIQQLQQIEHDLRSQIVSINSAYQNKETSLITDIGNLKKTHGQQLNEIANLRSINQKLAKEVKAASMQVPEANFNNLNAEYNSCEKAARDMKNELDKKKISCEELKAEIEKKNVTLAKYEQDKQSRDTKEQELIDQYLALKKTVHGLTQEITDFTTLTIEKDKIIENLRIENEERAKKEEEEKAKTIEIPKNAETVVQVPEVVEEEFVLKKNTNDLAMTPSSSTSEEFEKVVQEKEKLQAKVEELRARNIAILEKIEHAEKPTTKKEFDIEGERKKVVETIGKLTKTSFENLNDNKGYLKWLQDSVSSVQKELSAPKVVPVVQAQKSAVAETKQASGNNEQAGYRVVVKTLLDELVRIEQLATKQETKN